MRTEKTMVYIGPSIEHVVQSGTAFRGGYPPKVQEAITNRPYLQGLFVPADRLAQTKKELRDPGSAIRTLYRTAEEGGN
ncbi:hypothetical protein DWX10_16265 [Clostridium sp. AF18-27]|uniref:hypothetical protein n=1 Tax=Enterocloster lavalensis TaxID=460384 RepID=UPI000E47A018|nr:hypothetical protein [Enterocloster lavalensis]RHR51972.1 hypothetical protein DWX10_16265 [Clostridium sp. AF18-27]